MRDKSRRPARVLVNGSAIFQVAEMAVAIRELRALPGRETATRPLSERLHPTS